MDEQIKDLWDAANTHAMVMGGEYIVEHDGEDIPPMPASLK